MGTVLQFPTGKPISTPGDRGEIDRLTQEQLRLHELIREHSGELWLEARKKRDGGRGIRRWRGFSTWFVLRENGAVEIVFKDRPTRTELLTVHFTDVSSPEGSRPVICATNGEVVSA